MIERIKHHNLGTINKNRVIIETQDGTFDLTFSYLALVGISWSCSKQSSKAVIKNYWSNTTGKLLNELEPDKSKRLDDKAFEREVQNMFEYINK